MPSAPASAVLYARLLGRARLRHLQLMVAIADQGNLRRAAEQVGVTQPAATQALAELEQLIDTPLFERHARGMRTTAAGQLLIPVVRQMLAALQASTESLSALQQGEGLLRIGMIPAAASSLARFVVRDFVSRHPGIRLEVREDKGEHLMESLISGGLDAVLSRQPSPLPALVTFHPLLQDEAVVLAGRQHPLAGQPGLRMADLVQARWLLAPAGMRVRDLMDRFSATADASLHIHPVTTTSLAFLVEILKDNETLVLIPRSLGYSLCAWGLACALDVTDVSALEGIGLLATPESLKHPAMQSMLDVLQQGAAAIA